MKKRIVAAFWLFLLMLRPNIQTNSIEPSSQMIRVPQDYPTIQVAINSVEPGGTIIVSNGTYKENIVITNKTLQLIGEDKRTTIIEGTVNGTIELSNVTNALIRGFTVINKDSAAKNFPIRLHFANNNRVEACDLIAPSEYCGIWLEWSYGNTITGNNITSSGDYGVYLFEASNNTIADNRIASHNGILFSTYCENNTVIGNTVLTSNKSALHLYTCSNNTFYHNSFVNMSNPVFSVSSVNSWDNGFFEGNYWSAYGRGFNLTTGIGLEPFVIDGSNHDEYPLMNPYAPGDCNHDGEVNAIDADIVKSAWQSLMNGVNYNPHVDFNMDRIINVKDATVVGVNWAKRFSPLTTSLSERSGE